MSRHVLGKVLRWAPLQRVVGPDFAVDLGTSAFRVISSFGLQLDEPLCGEEGAMCRGAVADTERASRILRGILAHARRAGLGRPRIVISHPSDVTTAEKNDFLSVAWSAGAARVAAFPEPLAAAVGSGIDVASSHAQMIVDIGHGVTDGIILRDGQIVASKTVRLGCGDLQRATIEQVASLGIRISSTEVLGLIDGVALDNVPDDKILVLGLAGRRIPVDIAVLRNVLDAWLEAVASVPLGLFRDAPDEVGAELVESGLWVTGGGALLSEVIPAIARTTGLDVQRVRDPLSAVVLGNGDLLTAADRFDTWV